MFILILFWTITYHFLIRIMSHRFYFVLSSDKVRIQCIFTILRHCSAFTFWLYHKYMSVLPDNKYIVVYSTWVLKFFSIVLFLLKKKLITYSDEGRGLWSLHFLISIKHADCDNKSNDSFICRIYQTSLDQCIWYTTYHYFQHAYCLQI